MKKIKNIFKNKYFILLAIFFVFSITFTYAYFTSVLSTEGGSNRVVTTTGNLLLNFRDGEQVTMLNAYPNDYIEKEIAIENNGTLDASYNIYMDQIVNSIIGNELLISGTCTRYVDGSISGTCSNIALQPITTTGIQTLKGNIPISENEKHVYLLKILFKEMDKNQNYNQGKSFKGRIQVNEYAYDPSDNAVVNNAQISDLKLTATVTDGDGITSYCVTDASLNTCGTWIELDETTTSLTLTNIDVDDYDKKLWIKNTTGNIIYEDLTPNPQLTVNPDNGTWEGSTQNQTFNMEYLETKNISNPTKNGYDFLNWNVTGERSTISNGVFTMGIEATDLLAVWDPIEYTASINPNGGTWNSKTTTSTIKSDYKTNVNIPNPSRTGYTFTGWTLSNNTDCVLNSEELTMGINGCTLTASWQINDYPWIAYHNKQNANGSGYTLVSADTEENEAEYGSQVSPNTKTYTGFNSPNVQTITIVEDTNPPIHNIVNYNYLRKQFALTINPNSGTYNGTPNNTVLSDLYYQSETTLQAISRVGYNFNTWSISESTSSVTNNIFKMGNGNTTITASWNAITMNVTFNANGGQNDTVTSKSVTYASNYGTLPTPTRANYQFLGWYTESTSGTKIESTSTVTSTTNHVLYAHWQQLTPILQKINSVQTTYSDNTSSAYVTATTGIDFSNPSGATNGLGLYTNNKTGDGTVKYFRGGTYCEGVTTTSGTCNKSGYSYNPATCATDTSKSACEAAGGTWRDIANDVIFAGMHWKIMSIKGNSIKLIYNGLGNPSLYNYAMSSVGSYSTEETFGSYGFKTGTYVDPLTLEEGYSSNTFNFNMSNTTNSAALNALETFYTTNLSSYSSYMTDGGFCNDRTGSLSVYYQWQEKYVEFNGTAVDRTTTTYLPSLACNTNDYFTTTSSTTGNKSLRYPIGLITADEAIMAGILYDTTWTKDGTLSYLNVAGSFWTMTPESAMYIYDSFNSGPSLYNISGGRMQRQKLGSSGSSGFRPVITISGSSLSTGTGKIDDPYIIK